MNTITRITVIAAVTTAALIWASNVAVASTPRGPEAARAGITIAPFSEPIGTLDGRTLAQYVAEHVERRLG
jgi:hypothetical protein